MEFDREPNWDKWRHIPHATVWELVALSLNIEPEAVQFNPHGWMADRHIFDESDEFKDRVSVAGRNAGGGGGLTPKGGSLVDPADIVVGLREFAAWALSLPWEIPEEFAELASGHRDPGIAGNRSTTANENPIGTRERGTLLKLILGMALEQYGFDPDAAKSPVPKEISDDLQTHGISVSDDTVRRWLKIAADEVDWKSSRG